MSSRHCWRGGPLSAQAAGLFARADGPTSSAQLPTSLSASALASTYQGMGGGRAGVVELGAAMWRGWMGCVGWTQRGEGGTGRAPPQTSTRRLTRA